MDLGQDYTEFVDDIEGGEFDNFLSKSKRRELKAKRDRIQELRKGGMRLKDAIIQTSKEAMDKRRGDVIKIRSIAQNIDTAQKPLYKPKMKRPLFKPVKLEDNDIDEEVEVKEQLPNTRPIQDTIDIEVDGVDTDTPKEEGFVQKYKTLLMIGGGLAVAFVLFKKFGK